MFQSTKDQQQIRVNYNNSLTWINVIWGWFPLIFRGWFPLIFLINHDKPGFKGMFFYRDLIYPNHVHHFMPVRSHPYSIRVNYNISSIFHPFSKLFHNLNLVAIWGWFPYKKHDSQWGRTVRSWWNLPRFHLRLLHLQHLHLQLLSPGTDARHGLIRWAHDILQRGQLRVAVLSHLGTVEGWVITVK